MFFAIPFGTRESGSGPTITYATWDPSNCGSGISLSGGNLTETSSSTGEVRATIPVTSGNKRFWEITVGGSSTVNMVIGIDNGTGILNNYTGQSSGTYGLYGGGYGVLYVGGWLGGITSLAAYSPGNVIGIALDLVVNTIQFYINGVADGSPFSIPSGNYYPACGSGGGSMITTANFGATTFAYPVPTGFTGGVY